MANLASEFTFWVMQLQEKNGSSSLYMCEATPYIGLLYTPVKVSVSLTSIKYLHVKTETWLLGLGCKVLYQLF